MKQYLWVSSAAFVIGALRVKVTGNIMRRDKFYTEEFISLFRFIYKKVICSW